MAAEAGPPCSTRQANACATSHREMHSARQQMPVLLPCTAPAAAHPSPSGATSCGAAPWARPAGWPAAAPAAPQGRRAGAPAPRQHRGAGRHGGLPGGRLAGRWALAGPCPHDVECAQRQATAATCTIAAQQRRQQARSGRGWESKAKPKAAPHLGLRADGAQVLEHALLQLNRVKVAHNRHLRAGRGSGAQGGGWEGWQEEAWVVVLLLL